MTGRVRSAWLPLASAFGCSGLSAPPATTSPPLATGPTSATSGSSALSSTASGALGPQSRGATCALEHPAFCERFEEPAPGGRAGPLDERRWHLARWGHETRQFFVRVPASTESGARFPSTFCGKPFAKLLPPADVAFCDGIGIDGQRSLRMNEVFDDQGDFGFNSFRVRQPFDFSDRTGRITFDVDAKINPLNLGHGWWIELFVTADAAPMPYHEAPGVLSYPKDGVGFAFQGFTDCEQNETLWGNELNRVFVSHDYRIIHDYPSGELDHPSDPGRCFKTADDKLQHFEVRLAKNRAEVWVSDFDHPLAMRRVASAEPLDLAFSRGYVHLQHAHYNARKDGGVTGVQTYRWDNVGFDGPVLAVPRASEFPDNDAPDIDDTGGKLYGYPLGDRAFTRLRVGNVELAGAARATLDFNIVANTGRGLVYRWNGGPEHVFRVPRFDEREGVRGFSLPIPLAELVNGDNTLELKMSAPQTYPYEYVGNLELTLEPGG